MRCPPYHRFSRKACSVHKSKVVSREVYIDFGVRKPHAVLVGDARQPIFLNDLQALGLSRCKVFIEAGCPTELLKGILEDNDVFVVPGDRVRRFREAIGLRKTDSNDAFSLRDLARQENGRFRQLAHRDSNEIDNQNRYAYYCQVSALIASLKNRQHAFKTEFGVGLPELNTILSDLGKVKESAATCFQRFEKDARTFGVRGAGPRYIGGILIKAAPRRFPSLSAYLRYCGLKASSVTTGRYSRHSRALYHQLATSVIMHKDPCFYRLYRKVKRDLSRRRPEYKPSRIEAMARNRLATFLAKRVFNDLRNA